MFGKNGWSWFKKNKKSNVEEIEIKPKRNYGPFPCSSDNCLVRAACTKPCDKLEMDDKKLKELFEKYMACPDCGSTEYQEGPSGGGAQNVKCAGCGHYFNLAFPLFVHRIHCDSGVFKNPW